MKRISLLFTASLLWLFVTQLNAQSTNYTHLQFFAPDSSNLITICPGNTLTVTTGTSSTGYAIGDVVTIGVDWGDGNTQTNPATILQSSYYNPNLYTHLYAASGTYQAIFSFSDTYGQTDLDTLVVHVNNNCGTIWTNVMLDTDANGTGDVWQPGALVDFTGADNVTITASIGGGVNGLDITQSPYVLTVNPAWMALNGFLMNPSTPASYTVAISAAQPNNDSPSLIVICDPANPVTQTDLALSYVYGSFFRAGQQTGYLRFNLCNYSCSGSENADLEIEFESLLSVYSHDIPGATVSGNTISANLNVSGCQTYTIYFDVPGPTPAGTPLNFEVSIEPTATTDFDLANNVVSYQSEVRNSWDPNDKAVNKPEVISPSVQDELTYVIRFQNMGNDDAYNIVVRDTLDADLELSSFVLLENSHPVQVTVDPVSREAKFFFPNINLPAASVNEPASHGTIVYKIKEKPALPYGTAIDNTAHIYFDYNPPIITNTTHNVNITLSVDEQTNDDITAYPVPATDYLVVSSKQNQPIESIRMIDITGKVIMNVTITQSSHLLDLQGIASGAYTVVIQSQGTIVNKKIMVRK